MTPEACSPSAQQDETLDEGARAGGLGTLVLRAWQEPDGQVRVRILSSEGDGPLVTTAVAGTSDEALSAVGTWLREHVGHGGATLRAAGA